MSSACFSATLTWMLAATASASFSASSISDSWTDVSDDSLRLSFA